MSEPLSARPESRFALVSGVAGALAAAAMVFVGVWGLALGCVWHAFRKTQSYYRAVLLLASVVAIGVPAFTGWQIWQGLALERAVAQAPAMDARQLERALDDSPWRDNRFFIGAIVQNKAAGEALLDRIARLPDPEPYERMGSLWNVQGENRKGLAAMRLIAYHPNVSAATLQRLAEGPHADKVLHDVLRNRKTPHAPPRKQSIIT